MYLCYRFHHATIRGEDINIRQGICLIFIE
jgi:hypothetical protein